MNSRLLDFKEPKYSRECKRQDSPVLSTAALQWVWYFPLLPGLTLRFSQWAVCLVLPASAASAEGTADHLSFTWQFLLPTDCCSFLTFRLHNFTISWLEFKPFLYISTLTHNTIYLLIPYIHMCQERRKTGVSVEQPCWVLPPPVLLASPVIKYRLTIQSGEVLGSCSGSRLIGFLV